MTNEPSLNDQLSGGTIIVAPGIFDALGAVLVERAGFHTA